VDFRVDYGVIVVQILVPTCFYVNGDVITVQSFNFPKAQVFLIMVNISSPPLRPQQSEVTIFRIPPDQPLKPYLETMSEVRQSERAKRRVRINIVGYSRSSISALSQAPANFLVPYLEFSTFSSSYRFAHHS